MEWDTVCCVLDESDGCEDAGVVVEDSEPLLAVTEPDDDDDDDKCLVEVKTAVLLAEEVVEPCSPWDELGDGEEPESLVDEPTRLLFDEVTEC